MIIDPVFTSFITQISCKLQLKFIYILSSDLNYAVTIVISTRYRSNQIKSLLLSHHHSTSALVSEILMSVLQTVQKKPTTTIYIWTDSAKKQQTIYIWTDSAKKKKKQFTYGQTVQKSCTGAFTVLQTVQKNNNNLHMDSTYLQTVQKTMCKIHKLSTHSVL